MLVAQVLNIEKMEKIIYVKLLEEGTKVYRPVTAFKIENNVYEVRGSEIHDPDDELWEFVPGTFVFVEKQNLDGEIVLVAVKEYKK